LDVVIVVHVFYVFNNFGGLAVLAVGRY